MGASNVVKSSDGYSQVRTYTGITTDDVQAAFEADRADAKRKGWVPVSQRWDASQPIPTLAIEYRHWSGPRRRRSKSRWSAIGVVAASAIVLLVLASGDDAEDEPVEGGPAGDPAQAANVVVPDRTSSPAR